MIQISKLLENFKTGNYSEQELNDLIDVMQKPLYEEAVGISMKLYWDKCENTVIGDEQRFQRILNEIHHSINIKAKTKTSWTKALYVQFSKVAAFIVIPLIIALCLTIKYQLPTNLATLQNTISVPLGSTSQMDLPDGTHIWLNAGSKLTYPISFVNQSRRIVVLNGEGFFKVKKDTKCPFILKMNEIDIKVTGTAFNARAYNDEPNVTVALVEGSVILGKQMSENNFKLRSSLHPMEVAILNKANKKITLTKTEDLTKYTAWTEGRTVFDNDPTQIVVEKLEKLYNIQVVIHDKELLQYHFTATFINESLDRALKILSLSSPIQYQIINKKPGINGVYGRRTLVLRKESGMIDRKN